MPQSLLELGDLCDRAAGKLYDRPADDDALADIATIVLLIASQLRRTVGPPDAATPHGRAVAASAMALISVDRRLSRLDPSPADGRDDEPLRVVSAALRLVTRVLLVLQNAPLSRSAAPAL
jgi:hypothetical protein